MTPMKTATSQPSPTTRGRRHPEALDGGLEKPSPLRLTWDAATSLREDIIDVLGDICCFVIAALLFPDMEPDPAIVAEGRRSNVHVLWGTDNLMNRLAAIAARKAYYPPNAEDIRREVAAVTDGQTAYAGEAPEQPEAPAVPRLEIPAAGITIGHVDTLIVHTGPDPVTDAGRDPEPGS